MEAVSRAWFLQIEKRQELLVAASSVYETIQHRALGRTCAEAYMATPSSIHYNCVLESGEFGSLWCNMLAS